MKNAAAIAAQVVDIQNDRQHKGFIKVTLHVPAEQGATLTESLGWPTYTDPVSVAIARLNPNKVGVATPEREADKDRTAPADPPASRKPVAPDRRLAQRAGILCSDPLFHKWLGEIAKMSDVTEEDAAIYVRTKCEVQSRSEIKPGTEAAYRFAWIESAFICWRDKDKFVEAAE